MTYGISRGQALALVRKHIHSTNLINHSLASEAVMRRLAEELGEELEHATSLSSSTNSPT